MRQTGIDLEIKAELFEKRLIKKGEFKDKKRIITNAFRKKDPAVEYLLAKALTRIHNIKQNAKVRAIGYRFILNKTNMFRERYLVQALKEFTQVNSHEAVAMILSEMRRSEIESLKRRPDIDGKLRKILEIAEKYIRE